jgi:ribonuclease J
MEDRIRQSLRRFFRNVLDRDPIVVPIVVRV